MSRFYAVSLNPALDVTLWTKSLSPGEPCRAVRERIDPGSKAVNLSRTLTSLGLSVQLFCIAGSGNTGLLKELLTDQKVDFHLLETPGFIRENLILIPEGSEPVRLERSGPEVSDSLLQAFVGRVLESIEGDAPIVVCSGSLPANMAPQTYGAMASSFRASGARLVLDNDFFTARELLELSPFCIKPNLPEFGRIIGRQIPDVTALFREAERLNEKIPHVLVSMGEAGLAYSGNAGRWVAQVPKVTVQSAVGAGDNTLAGFLAALETGRSIEDSVRFAAACGTASVTLEGTAVVTGKDVEAVLPEIRLKRF